MKRIAIFILILPFVLSCSGNKCGVVTVQSLLDEMVDPYSCTEFPATIYATGIISSHDRKSVQVGTPEWFANEDGFGYERLENNEGREEKVLFDQDGPGVITRIWLTTRNSKSTIRFYFDGSDTPDWIVPAFDMTDFGMSSLTDSPLVQCHTSYEKGKVGGQTFFFPIPYSKSCKVTLEEPEGWTGVPRYYQIEYRKYCGGTGVKTFSVKDVKEYKKAIEKCNRDLEDGIVPRGRFISSKNSSLILPDGENAVTSLKVIISGMDSLNYENSMRSLILSCRFDGVETVRVPLGDFSGAGLGAREVYCRQLISDGAGEVTSLWVMPYSREGSIEILDPTNIGCGVEIQATVEKHRFGSNTLYFHSSWKSSDGLCVSPDPAQCTEWDFITLEGRGYYVGDNLSLFNHSRAWYGEGDEKIYVDGESFPSYFGTGTEDYYNSSWAPVVVFHTPFGGAPRADLPSSAGYNTFLRTRLLDAIPFNSSLDFNFELISWVPGTVDYSSTIYWYGDAEASAVDADDPCQKEYDFPEPPQDPLKFVIDNSIEGESLKPLYVSDGLNYDIQDMAGFPDGIWSGSKQLTFYGGKIGDNAKLRITGLENARYKVSVIVTKAADYGISSFKIENGEPCVIDCYFPSVVNSEKTFIDEVDVKEGSFDVDITITGQNKQSKGTMFGIDCFVIEHE